MIPCRSLCHLSLRSLSYKLKVGAGSVIPKEHYVQECRLGARSWAACDVGVNRRHTAVSWGLGTS